jgi:ribosomal protein S18 acetylase RimI-like enzyme
LRFLNNIVRFPGCGTFDPRASFVVFQRRTRTLIGLILCSLVRPDVGHITQVCVLPEYRSAGWAKPCWRPRPGICASGDSISFR